MEQLASVAQAVKYKALVLQTSEPQKFQDVICRLIDKDCPPIVAFDVEKGDPVTTAMGQKSHWGVVIGWVKNPGKLYYVATHGSGKYYWWTARSLQESNFSLDGTVRACKPRSKAGSTISIPRPRI